MKDVNWIETIVVVDKQLCFCLDYGLHKENTYYCCSGCYGDRRDYCGSM